MDFPVYLKTGEQVRVNDHVYCSPSWAQRDGTPYSIARIMAFLGPENPPKGTGDEIYLYTRVRLAWYYRPCDVSDRPVADPRLLLAAIYSEVLPINQLRGKCFVLHRDKIPDLSSYKKRPDRFYFSRLFDPYIKKEFEVIQSSDVRNLPDNIRETLCSRYEYVVAEKEVISDLTDNVRVCESCTQWCPNPESVQCARCKKYFHMSCVQPPLAAKPARGYGWTCAPCSRAHEEEVDSHDVHHTPQTRNQTKAIATRGRGRPRKDRTGDLKEEMLPIKHFKMWPFRYFGQYTVAEDTLDPDDLIFPRTATRVGPKYQVVVLTAPEMENTTLGIEPRGDDETIEVMSAVHDFNEKQLEEYEEIKRRLAADEKVFSDVDYQTEVTHRLTDAFLAGRPFSSVDMKSPYRTEKWSTEQKLYKDKDWTPQEIAAFEGAIQEHGAELRAVREEVGTRTMKEVVRFYGHWKAERLGEENRRQRNETKIDAPPIYFDDQTSAAAGQHVGPQEDEGSIVAAPTGKNASCGACRTRNSDVWWKAPKGLSTNVLCDTCGTNWRKYADLNMRPVREEATAAKEKNENGKRNADKREGTPLTAPGAKRQRATASAASTPPLSSAAAGPRCMVCHRSGGGQVVKCRVCQARFHASICGAVVKPGNIDNWLCEICENEESEETAINPFCLLCPRPRKDGKQKIRGPPPDSFLRACKPTEGQGWAHVLCSVFIPDTCFTDPATMRVVEGISVVPRSRWTGKCVLCGMPGGAVIRCYDCTREFHVSCAYKVGHKFGFEIAQNKNSRKDASAVTMFKGETGNMMAIISCKEHKGLHLNMHDMCDMNEKGETALQVFCEAHKRAPVNQAHGLLRKARRFDAVLGVRDMQSFEVEAEKTCVKCATHCTPLWHPVPADADAMSVDGNTVLCHRCHFEANNGAPAPNGAANGSMSEDANMVDVPGPVANGATATGAESDVAMAVDCE
ncbi:hypothetical protein BD626DRAFT_438803 [Schizophyllum amplum]|uniref:Uncharacterized protein n=1 Tax=Schizophyllum amplum TaxID=97359 RepID=A0A550BZC0_9AGAR|nr:hypothetical protein BD626DRAFT_438803 [Auriculariopsis ampla]